MSKRVIESTDDGTEESRQTKHPYQPVWMAHWMRPGSKDPVSTFEDLAKGLEASTSVKEAPVIETKSESESPRMSSKSSTIKPADSTNLELSNAREYEGNIQSPSEVAAVTETSLKKYNFVTSKNPLECVKDTRPVNLTPFLGSTTEIMQYCTRKSNKLDKEKSVLTPLSSGPLIFSKNQFPNTTLRILDQEHFQNHVRVPDKLTAAVGLPRVSQKTHSMFITKCADVNVSSENNVYRSASNVEGQGNAGDLGVGSSKAAMKNESSADTDTMDITYLKEGRSTSVANYVSSTKGFNFGPKLNVATSREVLHPWKSTGLPDINLELPVIQNAPPISSPTQSLDMDVLLSPAEQPTSKYSKEDPACRWVKRLKQTTSDSSGRVTKADNLSYDNKRVVFKSTRQILDKNLCRDVVVYHGSQIVDKENEERKELLSSHAWIKRWMLKASQIHEKMPEPVVVCEPQIIDDLGKKELPTFAALALVGSTMKGYKSNKVEKRGSYSVWNTKDL